MNCFLWMIRPMKKIIILLCLLFELIACNTGTGPVNGRPDEGVNSPASRSTMNDPSLAALSIDSLSAEKKASLKKEWDALAWENILPWVECGVKVISAKPDGITEKDCQHKLDWCKGEMAKQDFAKIKGDIFSCKQLKVSEVNTCFEHHITIAKLYADEKINCSMSPTEIKAAGDSNQLQNLMQQVSDCVKKTTDCGGIEKSAYDKIGDTAKGGGGGPKAEGGGGK